MKITASGISHIPQPMPQPQELSCIILFIFIEIGACLILIKLVN
jgi:hypothetical protein